MRVYVICDKTMYVPNKAICTEAWIFCVKIVMGCRSNGGGDVVAKRACIYHPSPRS